MDERIRLAENDALARSWREIYAQLLDGRPLVEGVTGVDVGLDPQDPESGRLVVRVHVVDKDEPVPEVKARAERGEFVLLQGNYKYELGIPPVGSSTRYRRFPTVPPGVAISCEGCLPGTLGAFVRRGEKLAMLTAGHVLPRASINVFQPGYNVDQSRVASETVTRRDVFVDAAISYWARGRAIGYAQFETGVTLAQVANVAQSNIGEVVKKSGLGTEVREGVIEGVGGFLVSGQPIMGFCMVPMAGETRLLSSDGDSGAVWFKADDGASTGVGVGLHVGGGTGGPAKDRRSIACQLTEVFDLFDLRFAF